MTVDGADAVAVPVRGEETRLISPFRPGPGRLPPYLAGREKEQALFRSWGASVAQGVPPPSPVILYGPRGNGKTALLVWLQRHLAAIPGMEVVHLTPSDIRTPERFAGALLSNAWLARFTPKELSVLGLTWRPGGSQPPPTAKEVIRLRASKRPLALLLDEAHTLSAEVGNELLNAGQQLGAELPFFLVLAGTPDLSDRLSEMEASFWGRSELIQVNRLDRESAAAAIQRPLREEGLSIASPALDRILSESHGYPYFLQMWGRLVWERAAGRQGNSVTARDVEDAAPDFEKRRDVCYEQRYRELERREILPAARSVARAFSRATTLSFREVDRAIRDAAESAEAGLSPFGVTTAMLHLGFIWKPDSARVWEPGIPSLMDYIREEASAS